MSRTQRLCCQSHRVEREHSARQLLDESHPNSWQTGDLAPQRARHVDEGRKMIPN
jgi:hypothetical protein